MRNLRPWQEFIIGIALLITGVIFQNSVSTVVGDLLVILSTVVILIAIVHGCISLFTSKPLRIVKQTCSAMLSSFIALKQRYPEASTEDIYEKILTARYQDGMTTMQVAAKAKQNVGPMYFDKYNLRAITLAAVVHETGLKRSHFDENSKETKLFDEIVKVINRKIPDTL